MYELAALEQNIDIPQVLVGMLSAWWVEGWNSRKLLCNCKRRARQLADWRYMAAPQRHDACQVTTLEEGPFLR